MRLSPAALTLLLAFAPVCLAQTPAPKKPAPPHTATTTARPAATAKPAAAPSRPFTASGLNDEDDFVRIYTGDFANVRIDVASPGFTTIISSYMNDYATECKRYLPANRVEITKQVCAETSTPVNGYGAPVGASTCVRYETVGTGLYADPALYDAQRAADAAAARKMLGNLGGMLANPLSAAQQMTDQVTQVGTEMDSLIQKNACATPALRAFEANLIRFAEGDQPIRNAPPPPSAAEAAAAAAGPITDANFSRLLDDLVADNARGWAMNRYQPGSITGINIVARDAQGRPARLTAQYAFSSFAGAQRGGVTLSFRNGAPDCLYFSDFPDSCRLPAAGIVSAYNKNAYAK